MLQARPSYRCPLGGFRFQNAGVEISHEYANGVKLHFTGSGPGLGELRHGVTFEGTGGWVLLHRGVLEAQPQSMLESKSGPDELHLPVSEPQEENFVECVKSRGRTICPVDVSVRSDTVCQLAWITFKLQNRKLKWDPEKEIFTNGPDANRFTKRTLRASWRYEA